MEITLNEKDRDFIAEKCAQLLEKRIMAALLSDVGYEHMSEQVTKWVNMHTSEAMIRGVAEQAVEKQVDVAVREAVRIYTAVSPGSDLQRAVRTAIFDTVRKETEILIDRLTDN